MIREKEIRKERGDWKTLTKLKTTRIKTKMNPRKSSNYQSHERGTDAMGGTNNFRGGKRKLSNELRGFKANRISH